jgi:hypothetical protein
VCVGNDATEVGSSLITNAGAENHGLGILLDKEAEHLVEGKRAAHISVEDEEAFGPTLEDGITEVVQTTSGAESFVLAEILDGDRRELFGGVLDEVTEDRLVVVTDDVDLLDLLVGDAGDRAEAVPDDGVTGDFEERFRDIEREGTESGASGRTADLE